MRSVPERFWPKVDKGAADECWPWLAQTLPARYGMLRVKRGGVWRYGYSHRIAWELAHGPIPAGQVVLHRCDNPPCCNPAHLFLGTHADNVADKVRKGRQHRGEKVPNARLTEAMVRRIRALRGEQSRIVAVMCGVAPRTVRDVWNRKTWGWVD